MIDFLSYIGETEAERKEQDRKDIEAEAKWKARLAKIPQSKKISDCKGIIDSGKTGSSKAWLQSDTIMNQLCLAKDSSTYEIFVQCKDAISPTFDPFGKKAASKLREMFGFKVVGKAVGQACVQAAYETAKAEWNNLKKGIVVSAVESRQKAAQALLAARSENRAGEVREGSGMDIPWGIVFAVTGVVVAIGGGIAAYYTFKKET